MSGRHHNQLGYPAAGTPSSHGPTLIISYALFYAKRGASVVVNDVSEKNAQAVVEEIIKGESRLTIPSTTYLNADPASKLPKIPAELYSPTAGGKAAIAPGSVAEGQKIIDAAVKAFGTVHILINNAGILRKCHHLIPITTQPLP